MEKHKSDHTGDYRTYNNAEFGMIQKISLCRKTERQICDKQRDREADASEHGN